MRADPEIDALLGNALPAVVAPSTGKAMAFVGGPYDGADRYSTELATWQPSLGSADFDILPDKPVLDARVRDTLRNDSYVQSGLAMHKDNIVGSMFLLNSKPDFKVLGLEETWAEEYQEEVESKFTLWAESDNNWPDAARVNTLTSLVRLAVGVYGMAGEVLASAEWMRDTARPFNTAIQMIDLDRLSNPNGVINNALLRGGVQRDRYGAPLGYHVRMAHPTDYFNPDSYMWKYVPIRKPWGRLQMIHIVEQTRPDQTRGVAEMVSALKELRITKKFRDIVLQNAVVNATYAASIESDLPSDAVFQALGGGNMGDTAGGAISWASSYLAAIQQYAGGAKNLKLDGVKIPHLFPGTKLQLRPAGQGGPLGTEFEQSLLRYIAANLNVSYEQLSRDYSQSNYSSIRAAMTETWKFMQARKRMVADRFASSIFRLWLEEAINKNQIATLSKASPSFYEGLNADAYAKCEWIGASRGQIDELKETQAAVLRLDNGLSTLEDEHGRMGKDWRAVIRQRKREKTLLVEAGLYVDPNSQNTKNALKPSTEADNPDSKPAKKKKQNA